MSTFPPSLLQIYTLPDHAKVSDAAWRTYLTEEVLPKAVSSGLGTRAALYEAYHDFVLATSTPQPADEKTFLVVIHSDMAVPSESVAYKKLFATNSNSKAFPGRDVKSLARWEVRNSSLSQDVDPLGLGDSEYITHYILHTTSARSHLTVMTQNIEEPPFLLTCEIEPHDDTDYDRFYREEHLGNLLKVPGYRRTARYKLGPVEGDAKDRIPRFFAAHEWDTLQYMNGPELLYADHTPWAERILGNAAFLDVRGYKFVKGVGYDK